MTSPAFANSRWTLAGDQRREEMRPFCRKLLKRLDGMGMPFYPAVGLMDQRTARHRYVTGLDPWPPMDNPFLDGAAIRFAHCVHEDRLDARSWYLFAEVGFDVARLARTPVLWGGFVHSAPDPGMFMLYEPPVRPGWHVDNRTYGVKGCPRYEPVFDGE